MKSQARPALPSSARPIDIGDLELVVQGRHHDPHSLLGPHPYEGAVTVRTLRPLAATVVVETPDGALVKLAHELGGVWVGVLPTATVPDYRIRLTYDDGIEHVVDDPYRFLPTLGEIDLHLIGEGRHEQLWNVLGAHVHTYDGPMGTVRGDDCAEGCGDRLLRIGMGRQHTVHSRNRRHCWIVGASPLLSEKPAKGAVA